MTRGAIPTTSFTNVSSSAIRFQQRPNRQLWRQHRRVDRKQLYRSAGRASELEPGYTCRRVHSHQQPRDRWPLQSRFSKRKESVTILFLTTVQIFSCGTPNAAFPCSTTGANTITIKDVSVRESYDFSGAYIFNAGGQHELRGGYQRFTIFNDVQSGNQRDRTISLQLRNLDNHSDRRQCNRYARSGRIGIFPAYRNQRHGIESQPGNLHPGQISADSPVNVESRYPCSRKKICPRLTHFRAR